MIHWTQFHFTYLIIKLYIAKYNSFTSFQSLHVGRTDSTCPHKFTILHFENICMMLFSNILQIIFKMFTTISIWLHLTKRGRWWKSRSVGQVLKTLHVLKPSPVCYSTGSVSYIIKACAEINPKGLNIYGVKNTISEDFWIIHFHKFTIALEMVLYDASFFLYSPM